MIRRSGWIAGLALAMTLIAVPAFGQAGSQTTSLSGVVVDMDGGVVPGATVVVKNNATGESLTNITNASGAYSFPGLSVGTYSVTITLQGFKTAEYKEVRLLSGTPGSLQTKLEIGTLSEVVNVTAGTDLVRAQTPTVSSTMNADFIQTLPRADRNALSFLIFLPGVQTIGGAGSARSSTISGLPQNTINITIDGISNSNLLQSGDGFFSMVVPRLDAVEEVTMTSATAGADATGQGAVQIRFVTRSGTNTLEASAYSFWQSKMFNSNAFFTRLSGLPRPENTNITYGGRVGGPIYLPKLVDGRGKAFFFFNQEEVYSPIETRRTRTLHSTDALAGNFRYNLSNPTTANLFQKVAQFAATQPAGVAAVINAANTYDPLIQQLLASMRAAAGTTGVISSHVTDPNRSTYDYFVPSKGLRHSPTTNITLNLTNKHRLQGSYYWQRFVNTPDTLNGADATFPGFPAFGWQASYRTSGSISLRSTLSGSMVNELRGGWQSSPVDFFANANAAMFENQGGWNISFPTVTSGNTTLFSTTNAASGNANGPQVRNTINWSLDDSLNILRGSHSLTLGGSFTRIDNWIDNSNIVRGVNLGFNTTSDPAAGAFTTANFPGASATDLAFARAIYAGLTGRVSSLPGTGRLNEAGTDYLYNGNAIQRERMDEYSFFAQDQWRWRPTVTITAGLRYELQYPMIPTNGVFTTVTPEYLCGPSGFGTGPDGRFCNMFNPGVLNNPGVVPQFTKYEANTKGYSVDYNNFAPNVGVSWRPNVQDGWLRSLLGDPEQGTISTGFSRSFNRERIDRFLTVYGGNPGSTTPATRSTASTAFPLVPAGETWPILFRQQERLGVPNFLKQPNFPLLATIQNDMRVFDPEIQVPFTDSWQVGLQRSVGKDMAVELRYIGNRNMLPWSNENWNDVNIYETGFLNEFQLAQQNLQANLQAGRGANFKYFGPGTGTSPLPIFLSHFTAGMNQAAALNPANYTSSQFGNSDWTDDLDAYFPNPWGIAGNLYSDNNGTWFNNAKGVGYATNFWVMNPLVDDATVMRNVRGGKAHQVILELRRRLSQGLAANISYTYAISKSFSNQELHLPLFERKNQNVPHAVKMIWTYDVPVGRGKRFGANMNRFMDAVAGGWTFSGTGRVQQQNFVLRSTVLVGMTLKEANAAMKAVRMVSDAAGVVTVWNFPQDIIDNTRKAYDTDPTSATGYAPGSAPTGRYFAPAGGPGCNYLYDGDCGTEPLWFNGRWFGEFDFRLAKSFDLPGKARFEFSAEVFNALMAKNFPVSLSPSNSANVFRITSTQSAARTAQLVWRVLW